jgi:hypothetical protein
MRCISGDKIDDNLPVHPSRIRLMIAQDLEYNFEDPLV